MGFLMPRHPLTNFEIIKGIIKMNQDLRELFQDIHFSSTSKQFNNVWVILHWIH